VRRGQLIGLALIGQTIECVGLAVVLFAVAGTSDWAGAWAWLAVLFVGGEFVIVLLGVKDPRLLKERLFDVIPEKGWDLLWVLITVPLFVGWLPFMALDAKRFHWSQLAVVWQVVGAIAVVIAFAVAGGAAVANTYAAAIVRVQTERGHHVVASGPYRILRHPMYAASLLFFPGTALLLSSGYGLVLSTALMAMFVLRTVFEDRVLHRELEGYTAYAAQVRYRLVPRVW
jgi:protein-S-isoprenylcysteine O-methyltransferase Ste14